MKRGDIYFIKSTYREEGSEQRGDRPAVIVSNDKNNEHSEVVEVVYLTTKPKTDLPTHVFTTSALSPSTILCEQIYSVSKQRVAEWIGELTENELQALDKALAISIGINFGNLTAAPVMREPTEEEIQKILEEMKAQKPEILPAEQDVQLVKLETERDLYKKFTNDLLAVMRGQALKNG